MNKIIVEKLIIEALSNEKPKFVKLSQFGKILAQDTQDGYTLRIHMGANGGMGRVGTETIESPSGHIVQGGYWMDWPEKSWKITDKKYYALPIEKRAAMEVEEQKRWNYRRNFMSYVEWRLNPGTLGWEEVATKYDRKKK
jgi:hypothetical protein